MADTTKLAKKKYYDRLIAQSQNKTKTAWNVVRSLTTKQNSNINDGELEIKIEGNVTRIPKIIANTFNRYFLDVVEETVAQILQQNTRILVMTITMIHI